MIQVQTEISRLESAKQAIATAIAGKGVTVPDGTLIDGMAALIASIEAGEGSSGDSGGGNAAYVTGTITTKYKTVAKNGLLFNVTGLGFKPSFAVVTFQTDVTTIGGGGITQNYSMVLMASGGLFDGAASAYSDTKGYKALTGANAATVVMDDDGFSVYNGSYGYAELWARTQSYIAFK